MATVRFYGEFMDEVGDTWRINLHDTDYSGTATEVTLGAEGFALSYSGNSEDRHQPIIGSSVEFTVMNEGGNFETFLNSVLPAAEEGRMQIEIRRDPDNVNALYWAGILAPEQVEQDDAPAPNPVRMTATDDLGNLQRLYFDQSDGSGFNEIRTPVEHMLQILNQMRTENLWGATDGFFRYVNDVEMSGYTGTDWLNEVQLDNPFVNDDNEIYEGNRGYNSYEILESIARSLNARVFQANGYWWFLPVNCYLRASQSDDWTTDVKQLDKSGTAAALTTGQTSELQSGYVNEIDADFVKLAGGIITYLPPLKRVRRTRNYWGNQLAVTQYSTGITTGDNITYNDTDRTYIEGIGFSLSGGCQIFLSEATVSNNPFNNAFIQLQLTIKCGSLYWTATGWSSTASEYVLSLAQFNQSDGFDAGLPWSVATEALPSQQVGLDVTIQLRIISALGTDITSNYTSDFLVLTSGIQLTGDQGLLGDDILFEAETSDDNRIEINQGSVLHGDPEGTILGAAYPIPYGNFSLTGYGNTYTSSQTSTAVSLHRLGVQEAMAQGQFPTQINKGQIFGRMFEMWQTIKEGTQYYAPFEFNVAMNSRETDVQRWLLNFDDTNVTSTELAVNNGDDTTDSALFQLSVMNVTQDIYERVSELRRGSLAMFHELRTIVNRDGGTAKVEENNNHIFNTWSGANGQARIFLPPIAESYGRTIQFHSDDTISANTYVTLFPDENDTGTTIDGASDYDFNRAYDGITILGHTDDNWYIIQKKDKGGGGSSALSSLVTTTPTLGTIADFESTGTGTITVTNYDSGTAYQLRLYDSNDSEVSHTLTDNNNGTWTITTGLSVATGYYVTVQAVGFGQLLSETATSNTFEARAAQTQMRYWRLQITDSTKRPVANKKIALGEFRLYTQTGASGTAYPSNMTSATTPSPYVVTKGYQFQSYNAYLAFDGSGSSAGSMWWTLGNHAAANAWIQIDLGSSIDLGGGECRISTSGGWTDADHAVLYGSNTGDFTGEEREMAFFQNIDKAGETGGTFTTYTQAIT